ncbi:hypothetical protein JYU34_012634 [Plutella xylostella]|uniref:Uncharacterized protein n=1 Tax=Plutella xylostella TaxID=51655 RepID=A0ABQ7QBS6_PLUXY|nr:hypothetical protein JYU34_012634 [Plutella xylostella]
MKMLYLIVWFCLHGVVCGSGHRDMAWSGGPARLECDHAAEMFMLKGQHVKENVIAVKAIAYKDDVYVLTPRLKRGVLATIWLVVAASRGVELQPYPDLSSHAVGDCRKLQNAVDFYLDHFGNLWVLDSGIIETLGQPLCTCQPKVLVLSLLLHQTTRELDLAGLVQPASLLQGIVVEYGIDGKQFVYISDASRGAIIVYDVPAGTGWSVLACAPAAGLQLAIIRRALGHAALVLVRIPHAGLIELDTGALRRQETLAPLRLFGEHTHIIILGASAHHVFLRLASSTDVLSWDTKAAFDSHHLETLHSSVPSLLPTSVAVDPLLYSIIVLDSNYPDTVQGNGPTYHRISFVDKIIY